MHRTVDALCHYAHFRKFVSLFHWTSGTQFQRIRKLSSLPSLEHWEHRERHIVPGLSDQHLRSPSDKLHEGSVWRIWSVISRIRGGKVEDVVHFLQCDRICSGIQLSEKVVIDLLQKFRDDWKSALGFFQWASLQSGYGHGADAYKKMVDLLGRTKQMDRMWILVGEMRSKGLLNVETIAKVMRRLTGAGKWEEAVRTFDNLEAMGFDKNCETLNILLDTLCKEKNAEVAHEMYLYHSANIPPDAYTFNILVHGWCLIGRIEEAERMILQMKGHGIPPSVITYSNILRAYCERFNISKAFELLDKMLAEGCPPNVISYQNMINSLAGSENIDAIFEIVERMKSAGCRPDIFFYNSLISILGRAGRVREASHVFDIEMHENGVSPDLSTFNTMISVLCQHSQGQMALDLLKEVEKSSWKPDHHTFSPLLKLCIRAGGVDDILCDLLNDMVNKHHLSLDSATYALLIHGLCRAGKCECAFLVFEEMMSRDILPRDQHTYDLLLAEAEKKGWSDTADRLKELMQKFKVFIRK